MEISSLNYEYVSVPAQLNCDDCSKTYEDKDTNDDGQLTIDEMGAAYSLSISDVIPKESIENEKLQDDLLSNFEKLNNNQLRQQEFNDFLKENELNVEEEQKDLMLSKALFEIQRKEQTNNNELSSYASMMDRINEQTQSSSMNEKLQAYTQNLRN